MKKELINLAEYLAQDQEFVEEFSKKETVETEDIFSEMCTEVTTSDEEDLNIF